MSYKRRSIGHAPQLLIYTQTSIVLPKNTRVQLKSIFNHTTFTAQNNKSRRGIFIYVNNTTKIVKMSTIFQLMNGDMFRLYLQPSSGALGSVVVKALRYQSDGLGIDSRWCHWGYFSWLPPTEPCALGLTQHLKMSARDFSQGKGGRCIWLKTYHPCGAERHENLGP